MNWAYKMKIYERFIPPQSQLEASFEDFCHSHGISPCKVSSKSKEAPLPYLRCQFAKKAHRELTVTYEEIGEVLNRSHVTITHYMNGHARIKEL